MPPRPHPLLVKARASIGAGALDDALRTLAEARDADPEDPSIPLDVALVLRRKGEVAPALAAVEDALALDPYSFLALLSKGSLQEALGDQRIAARTYRNALKVAPQEASLPASLRAATAHARQVVARNSDALADHLRARTRAIALRSSGADLDRFEETLEILSGRKRAYVHEPLLLHFAKLPALTFYDRAHFPWFAELEAQTQTIAEELGALLREDWEKFSPYIQLPSGAPVNQWEALNHSPSWNAAHLWRDGRRDDALCSKCPRTTAILERMPMARQVGFAPTAMFSVLAPKTTIPPHTGSSNARLICHLPLIVPEDCRFRVGNDIREWKIGEAFVFDDTIEHEAWNDSEKVRAVLIFDVWNPLLTELERELVTEMLTALNEYNAS